MADSPSFGDQDAVQGLQSSEQSQLLDAIDKVRRQNVDADMNIPQIIVCGDQSSGKSSVLEAIAQIRFPVGNQAVTKFPIEVVLRHAPESSITVKLHPSHDRPQSQREQVKKFRPACNVTDGANFKEVVQEAKAHLESIEPNRKFWSDWLSAEVSGPMQPHLTLVDLPGLIHFSEHGGKGQDVEKIKQSTCNYLRNERAIVLAVVNSVNDPANQQILSLVEQTGNAKQRTMGILTKPDEIRRGSEKEREVLGLARNEKIHFGLGWHVLRNVGHDEKDLDQSRRDHIEEDFFSSGAWSALSGENVGIGSLRSKLSRCLLGCIKKDLPKLTAEMQAKLKICTKQLSDLGESRERIDQQKEYLAKVLGHLQRILEAALDGQYRKAELMAFFDGSQGRQLRDVINRLSGDFAKDLRLNGKQFHVYDKDEQKNR